MIQGIFNWAWISLLCAMIITRKFHVKKAGNSASLKDTPLMEAVLMVSWGISASVIPLLIIFTELLTFADYPFNIHRILKFISLIVFMLSIWLLHRSHADLGKMWSLKVEPKNKGRLVTKGVYKRIRHPMYTAHLIWGIAQLMFFPNYIAGPSALIMFLALIMLRIPREEKALIEEFQEEYKRYILQTGCILPKIIH